MKTNNICGLFCFFKTSRQRSYAIIKNLIQVLVIHVHVLYTFKYFQDSKNSCLLLTQYSCNKDKNVKNYIIYLKDLTEIQII